MKKLCFLNFLFIVSALTSCSLLNFGKNGQSKNDDQTQEEQEENVDPIIIPIDDEEDDDDEDEEEIPPVKPNTAITFEGAAIPSNYDQFIASVKNGNNWNNDASNYGIVVSPYYSLLYTSDGNYQEAQVYGANVVQGLASFVCVNKIEDNCYFKLTYIQNITSVEIHSVACDEIPIQINGKTVSFKLEKSASYTFIFNGDFTKTITIFFEEEIEMDKQPMIRKVYSKGLHDYEIVANENERIVFKAGKHKIRNIVLKSNTEIYLEEGAILEAINPSKDTETPTNEKDWAGMMVFKPLIYAENAENIRIYGHGIFDLSKLGFHARNGLRFIRVNNVKIEGVMFNNAPEWTCTHCVCDNVNIKNTKIYGYRQNSDGFAVVDCSNVNIDNCFARSGDDLFEVKSMYGAETKEIKNIHFTNCVAWPEKARGFGIIAETKRDIKDVYYDTCICIQYPSKWMEALGALIVYVENDGNISNINFNNFKIHHCSFYPINVTLASYSHGSIKNIYFNNIYYYDNVKIRIKNESTSVLDNIEFRNVYRKGNKIISNDDYFYNSSNISNIKVY